MTLPVLSVLVDWNGDEDFTDTYDDITADVGAFSLRQAIDERGSCSLELNNITGKYTPGNTGGVLYGSLMPGRRVWMKATYGGTTYPLFYGPIRRIVLHPEDRTATLVCEDITAEWELTQADVIASSTRSIKSFRGALLDRVDTTAARRSLADGMEATIPGVTGADDASVGSVLSDIDTATGTISVVRAHNTIGTFYQYVTIDRATLEAAAAVEAWDAEAGDVHGLTNFDLTDEALINIQRVTATPPRLLPSGRVWTSGVLPITVPAGTSRMLWADFGSPVIGATIASTATNSPTITLTPFYATAKIEITAGASDAVVTDLGVTGYAVDEIETDAFEAQDATSVAPPPTGYGNRRGNPISSAWLASEAYAAGLAAYIVWRYATPRTRPDISRVNVFPSILSRVPGEVVTVTADRAAISAQRHLIRARDLSVHQSLTWVATYETEELPAALSLFTVGGTADQGVGGTAILGY